MSSYIPIRPCRGGKEGVQMSARLVDDSMKKELLALGFEEKEADIYLACIANKRSTPTELAQKTKLKRATVYFYWEKLRGKGLITSEVRVARRYASATSLKPALTQLLQSKKE